MTPADVAAIRADPFLESDDVIALCDALETAWASRGDMIKIALASLSDYREMRDRTERAEADYSDLENQFRLHRELCAGRLESLKRTQAALARVQKFRNSNSPHLWDTWQWDFQIGQAIEGDNQ